MIFKRYINYSISPFGDGPVEAREPGRVKGDVAGWTRVICGGK